MNTPVQKIINWINDKPIYWRHTVRLALSRGHLDNEAQSLIYKIANMEVGLQEKDDLFHSLYSIPVASAGFDHEEHSITLTKLGPVHNVSSLLEDQILSFKSNGMTVVYGDNGAGKSSYSKILKHACLTRGDLPKISGNVFLNNTSIPLAHISVLIDNTITKSLVWANGSQGIPELKSIRVFDTLASSHYIAKEGLIEYKPAGLRLLDELTKTCIFIAEKVNAAKRELLVPIKLPDMSPNTKVSHFIRAINTNTTEEEIASYCASTEEIEILEPLKAQLHTLKTKTAEQIRKEIFDFRKRIEPLKNKLETLSKLLSDIEVLQIQNLFNDFSTKKANADLLRQSTLTDLPFDNIGGSLWQTMWRAAEAFILSDNSNHSFPEQQDGHCPLCLQNINDESAARLQKFNEYIQDTTQKSANDAKKTVEEKITIINNISTNMEDFEPILNELEEKESGLKELVLSFISKLESRKNELIHKPILFTGDVLDTSALEYIKFYIEGLIKEENTIKNDADLATKIQNKSFDINEIEDRIALKNNLANYIQENSRKLKLKQLDEILQKTSTDSITRLSTQINQEVVTSKLEQAFIRELETMGFKDYSVKPSVRGQRGSQLFKLKLDTVSDNILDIASEGEQKCLALASFFAEIHADNRKSAVVFDDPVNSLDHKWRRKFAHRLAQEATIRQVIIFTHDLTFLKMLEEATENDLSVKALTRRAKQTGLILDRPPWDALKTQSRIGQLKEDLVHAKKYYTEGSQDTYSNAVRQLYGKKRETWERLVEEWLIYKVIERFSRTVQTQRVKHLVDIHENDVAIIESAMTKCSIFLDGHDSASELGIDTPTPEEVELDIMELEVYFTGLKKRRG